MACKTLLPLHGKCHFEFPFLNPSFSIASGNINQSLISDYDMKILFIIIIVPSAIILCNMVVLPQMRALPDSFFHVTFPKLSFF